VLKFTIRPSSSCPLYSLQMRLDELGSEEDIPNAFAGKIKLNDIS
jgi:hypothetical protein